MYVIRFAHTFCSNSVVVMPYFFMDPLESVTHNIRGCLWDHGLYLLLWRHNGRDVWNHQPHDCLLNRSFRRRSKKTLKLRVTGLCDEGPVTRKTFPFDDVIMSLSRRTSYHKTSWSFEAARFGFRLFQSFWNLPGVSALVLPSCLSYFSGVFIITPNLTALGLLERWR